MSMADAQTWTKLEAILPAGWSEATVSLLVDDRSQRARVGAVLEALSPDAAGNTFVFRVVAGGGTNGREAVKRALGKLDDERLPSVLTLLDATLAATPQGAATHVGSLALAWDAAQATLPADWSDVYAEVTIASPDLLERTALLLGPINPRRNGAATAFRFRAARVAGYGASPGMVRRCFERLDADSIGGTLTILRALCETRPVATQGPQWVEGGKNF